MTLSRLAQTIVLAQGWWRILIAFLAGAASTLALPPTNIWPVPFVTFPILIWLVDGAVGRLGGVLAAATAGWWFGFGYFLAGLYWLGHAFLVDAKTFGWLLPFAVTALPAAMAIYTALGLALARAIWTRGATRILALAAALTLAEWLRGHLFSGFPWNTYGYALISPLWLAQGSALIGIWGLTFLAVGIYSSPAVLADPRTDTKRPWLAPALSVAVIAALAIYGATRLAGTSTKKTADYLRLWFLRVHNDQRNHRARCRSKALPFFIQNGSHRTMVASDDQGAVIKKMRGSKLFIEVSKFFVGVLECRLHSLLFRIWIVKWLMGGRGDNRDEF